MSELMPECHNCGYDKTIEEIRKYKDESLTVSVCPICKTYDWEIPEEADEDEEVFNDSAKWAEEQSIQILKENNLFFSIHFTEPAENTLKGDREKIQSKVIELCDLLGSDTVWISKRENGLSINIMNIHFNEGAKDAD